MVKGWSLIWPQVGSAGLLSSSITWEVVSLVERSTSTITPARHGVVVVQMIDAFRLQAAGRIGLVGGLGDAVVEDVAYRRRA